jgi:hypothetical protein
MVLKWIIECQAFGPAVINAKNRLFDRLAFRGAKDNTKLAGGESAIPNRLRFSIRCVSEQGDYRNHDGDYQDEYRPDLHQQFHGPSNTGEFC